MKFKSIYQVAGLCGALALSPATFAENAEKGKSWSAQAELGFLRTAGNSDSETVNAKFKGSKGYGKFKHTLNLEALNSSQDDDRSAEKYTAKLQSDYDIGERSFLLGALDWEKDLFSSFDYKAAAVVGYGYKAIKSDDTILNFEIAPGYRISEEDPGDTEREFIARFGEKFSTELSANASFDQDLTVDWGDSNTVTKFGASITSQIAGAFSMKIGYSLTHNSDVSDDTSNTDTETSVTLVYDFGK